MTGNPGSGTVPCQLTRIPREHVSTRLLRIHLRPIAARNIHPRRLGWHAREIAVEEAGQ